MALLMGIFAGPVRSSLVIPGYNIVWVSRMREDALSEFHSLQRILYLPLSESQSRVFLACRASPLGTETRGARLTFLTFRSARALAKKVRAQQIAVRVVFLHSLRNIR